MTALADMDCPTLEAHASALETLLTHAKEQRQHREAQELEQRLQVLRAQIVERCSIF